MMTEVKQRLDHSIRSAKWIVAKGAERLPIIEKKLTVSNLKTAHLAVTALGFFIVYINGKRVGDEYYLPLNSLFCERKFTRLAYPNHDRFTYRCYYSSYDITSFLKDGENTLSIELGDGWYRQTFRTGEGNMDFGKDLGTRFSILLEDADGERAVGSDGGEQYRNGALLSAQIFTGEIYDARFEFLKKYTYHPVQTIELPNTALTPADSTPDRVIRRIEPRLIAANETRRIYDAGENVSGFVTLSCYAAEGEEIRVRFAEEFIDGELDFNSTVNWRRKTELPKQLMQDIVISSGKPFVYEPRFVWHAFRYFEVIGDAEPLSVAVVHSDLSVIAEFDSASPELNWYFGAAVRTQLNNMHAGIPSDCPHRERLGYTGDGQESARFAMVALDAKDFYRKWIRDIFDSQDPDSGHVNHTAPFAGGGGGPGGWGCAAIFMPYNYYKTYGEIGILREYYDRMKLWISYLVDHTENGLLVREEDGGWCLGEWLPLGTEALVPDPFVNTCFMILALRDLEEIAALLAHDSDRETLGQLRQTTEQALLDTYFDAATGSFAGGVQGADAFAVACGLGDERTLQNLIEKYRALGHFDTGIFGTAKLCDVLFANSAQDVAYELLSSHELGSFGYMMDREATTLFEDWEGIHSHDHPVFGASAKHLIEAILGIEESVRDNGRLGVCIAPKIPSALDFAKGMRVCACGTVRVSWKQASGFVDFAIEIPADASCRFHYGNEQRLLDGGKHTFRLPLVK